MSNKNYFQIVIYGYFNDSTRDFLPDYFYRELKKAETENYTKDEFTAGCIGIVNYWKNELKQKVYAQKKELLFMLNGLRNDTIKSKNKKLDIEYCINGLSNERPDGIGDITFDIQVKINNDLLGYLTYDDILNIENAINGAGSKIKTPQQTEKETDKVKHTAKEFALAYILDLYAKGEQIPTNRIEGSLDAKKLKRIGKEDYKFEKPDTFYRAVKEINKKYDVNKSKDLTNISNDWQRAVSSISKDWDKLNEYLK